IAGRGWFREGIAGRRGGLWRTAALIAATTATATAFVTATVAAGSTHIGAIIKFTIAIVAGSIRRSGIRQRAADTTVFTTGTLVNDGRKFTFVAGREQRHAESQRKAAQVDCVVHCFPCFICCSKTAIALP